MVRLSGYSEGFSKPNAEEVLIRFMIWWWK